MPRTEQRAGMGVSLAKGPVGLLGLLGLIYGISALIFAGHGFPTQHVPSGAVHGKTWLGLEVNGWSDLLFISAGLLLILAAPAHRGAKGVALLVGLLLGAAALIALARGNGVFGLLAADHLTELAWGAAGLLLVLLSLLPRVGAKTRSQALYEPAERPIAPRPRERRPRTMTVEAQSGTVTGEPVRTQARRARNIEDQDGPPSAGAYRTDNHNSLKETK